MELDKRTEHMLQGQSALAKKVFAAVPIQEAWSFTEIHRTMRNLGHTAAHITAVHACLGQLKDAKIIREPEKGKYQRTAASVVVKVDTKRRPEAKPTGVVTPTEAPHIFLQQTPVQEQLSMATLVETAAPVEPKNAVDMLLELGAEVEAFQTEIGQRFTKFRDALETIAERVELEQAENKEAVQTLEAFQALLAKGAKK